MAIGSRYGHWRLLAAIDMLLPYFSRLSCYSCYSRTFLQKQPITARRPQLSIFRSWNIAQCEHSTLLALLALLAWLFEAVRSS